MTRERRRNREGIRHLSINPQRRSGSMYMAKALLILAAAAATAIASPAPEPEIYDFYASYGEIDLGGDPAYDHAKKCTKIVGNGPRADLWKLLFHMRQIVLDADALTGVFGSRDVPETHVTQDADVTTVTRGYVFGTWHQPSSVDVPSDVSRRFIIRLGPLQLRTARRTVLIALVHDRGGDVECYEQWNGTIELRR